MTILELPDETFRKKDSVTKREEGGTANEQMQEQHLVGRLNFCLKLANCFKTMGKVAAGRRSLGLWN